MAMVVVVAKRHRIIQIITMIEKRSFGVEIEKMLDQLVFGKKRIQELKELVENLQSERKEEMRQRHVAVQRTADIWSVRRNVVLTFCRYHASYENNQQKWSTILEDTFWLKQPVTPFRSFRRAEVEKVRHGQDLRCHLVIMLK
jgi:polyribonucleotide nucleotidyltransferase